MHYVAVGHVCQDVTPDGLRWGGGVFYSGLTAAQLGADVTALTRCRIHPDLDPRLHWDIVPDTTTTVFENRYHPRTGQRVQHMHSRAATVPLDRLSKLRVVPDIIHFAPIANEIELADLPLFPPRCWLVATPQGWMRRTTPTNEVFHVDWVHAEHLLPRLKVLALSEEDVNGDLDLVRYYAGVVPFVLYTVGVHGVVLFEHGQPARVEAEPAKVVDTTGAGDVIAAAFVVRLYETGNAIEAARFGTVAAALSIEAMGAAGIPTRAQIEERYHR